MKKRNKAIWWIIGILAALLVLVVTSPLWFLSLASTVFTKYPGTYAAYTESYEEIMGQVGKRDIFIPDLTGITELTDEEVRVGYRMVMDSPFFWAKPDHCEVSININMYKEEGRKQYFFNRDIGEPSTEGTLLEYKGVTWVSLPRENHIKLGDTWYDVSYRDEANIFLDALTEYIIDQYLARL